MSENPSKNTRNHSGSTGNPSGYNAHFGDTKALKWLVEAKSNTHKTTVWQERERKLKEEAEEEHRKKEEVGASIKQEEVE